MPSPVSQAYPILAFREAEGHPATLRMRKVAVFGNAGGGRSTLARRLSQITGLPLHVIDMIRHRPGGGKVLRDEYLQTHARLLCEDTRIIDGFGCVASAWERFAVADTLIHVGLPFLSIIGGRRSAWRRAFSPVR